MKLKKILKESKDYLNDNPLLDVGINLENNFSKEKNITDSINNYKEQINILEGKLNKAMNVVVMGEVKAGKSTLLNAIIGSMVCATDVLEATSTITEIYYSEQKKAELYKNGELEAEGSIAEINKLLMSHQGEKEFFVGDILLSIGVPFESLKEFHLIDTPGLSTITEANSDKTKNFMQQADVVLWVFNANHLGQSDLKEELANLARLGKPLLGIINRIDEVDGSSSRLKQYLDRNFALYLEESFMTSGLKAFEAKKNNDKEALKESGLLKFLDYLREEIEINSEQIYNDSIISSAKANLRHYIKLNQIYGEKIKFIMEKTEEYVKNLEKEKARIVNDIEMMIISKFNKQLFKKEKKLLFKKIEESSSFRKNVLKKDITAFMKDNFNEETVKNWWSEIETLIDNKIKREWKKVSREIDDKLNNDLKKLASRQKNLLMEVEEGSSLPESNINLLDDAKEGATIAGVGGLGMATYTAFLGPAAASVTLGAAIGAIVPPLALAGAAFFAGYGWINKNKEKKEMELELNDKISDLKRKLKERWIESEVLPAVEEENYKICMDLKEEFVKKISSGISSDKLNDLDKQLNDYIFRGNNLLEKFNKSQ